MLQFPRIARRCAAALLVALAAAGAARLLRRARWGGAAAGLGLAAGFAAVLGVISGSPRHLAERLPALVILGLLAGLLAGLPRPALRVAGRKGEIGHLVVEEHAVDHPPRAEDRFHRRRHRHHIAIGIADDEVRGAGRLHRRIARRGLRTRRRTG